MIKDVASDVIKVLYFVSKSAEFKTGVYVTIVFGFSITLVVSITLLAFISKSHYKDKAVLSPMFKTISSS